MTKIKMTDELLAKVEDWNCETLGEAQEEASQLIDDMECDLAELKEYHSELLDLIDVHGEGFEIGDSDEDDCPVSNFAEARACYFIWSKQHPGDPQTPNETLSEEHDGIWHLQNVNGPLAVVTAAGDVIAVREFHSAYERLSAEGKCDSPGGAEYQRVLHEWIEDQPDDMEEFIVRRANAVPNHRDNAKPTASAKFMPPKTCCDWARVRYWLASQKTY